MKRKISGLLMVLICLSLLGCSTNKETSAKKQQAPAKETPQVTETVSVPEPTPPFETWGLGSTISKQISLNTDYDWYIDQMHTGYASDSNCGPSCTIMAAKWSDKTFPKSVEDARNTAPNDGGWWYLKNIHQFLVDNSIPCNLLYGVTLEGTIAQLDKGNILIFNINTGDITRNQNEKERTGKFYDENTGHFIILKGYRIVDNQTFFEVYDPYNNDRVYSDNTEKGKDRYYLASEVIYSANNWADKYITISKK